MSAILIIIMMITCNRVDPDTPILAGRQDVLPWPVEHIGDKYDNDHIVDHDNDACDNDDMLPRYSNTLMLLTKMLMISKAMTKHNENDDNVRKNRMTTMTMMITMMTI